MGLWIFPEETEPFIDPQLVHDSIGSNGLKNPEVIGRKPLNIEEPTPNRFQNRVIEAFEEAAYVECDSKAVAKAADERHSVEGMIDVALSPAIWPDYPAVGQSSI